MKKSLAVMLALIMVLCMIPTTAFAEAGEWDPLTDPKTVKGSLEGSKTFSASTTMEAGKDGYLRLMPTLDTVNYTYNAMAYCGAKAKSNNTSIVEVKSIEIGKWVGGVWDNADCLQVTVNPKAAGTTTVVINFYYTFSQSANPLTNPNAKWFYGTSNYTINVTEPTKPNPPTPENTSKPVVGLTGEEAVQVHCTNSTANHTDESYGLKPNSYTVSNVEGNATNGYTCTITVQSEKYVNDYNASINVNHKLDGSSTGTIKLKWNETDKKWVVDSALPVVFNVKCDNTQPPTDKPEKPEPENTSKPVAGLTSKDAVEVECITKNSGHAKQAYQLIADSYDVGAVSGNKEKGYTCEITVKPEKYVTQYNLDIEVEHKLVRPENYTITLNWDAADGQWKYTENKLPVTFTVKCDTVPEETYYTVTYTDGVADEEVFADQTTSDLRFGAATPAFNGTPTRAGYTFTGWNPAVADTVTGNVTYTAQWSENTYSVTYTDGVADEEVFADQTTSDLRFGAATPAFNGTPTRAGYTFTGWTPAVTDTVTDNVTYTAQWKNNDNHTPGDGNGSGGHYHPTTPVPVIVIPPKTGDMTIWQSILHFLGIR